MKFSIVTPAWEVAPWLPETIESVLSQRGNFSIEYIVVADRSKDKTVEIAKDYAARVSAGTYPHACKSVSMQVIEPDAAEGMYVAINKGFSITNGDIQAWVPGDDLYEPGAFQAIAEVFTAYPEAVWLKGISSIINENGKRLNEGASRLYHQDWLRAGVYGMEAYHVEQESVFWRSKLWSQAGPFPQHFRSAGDYWLWLQMAKYAPLISIDTKVSCFRKRIGQDSRVNSNRLLAQKKSARPHRPLAAWPPRFFFWPYFNLPNPLQPFLEHLYKYVFPFRSRRYLRKENGLWIWRTMPSFRLH